MPVPVIGQVAPSFRLPSGQGPEIGPEDFRGRRHVIVWFTKGMACPFCRQKMSQIARGYPDFQALGGEVLEVTGSTPARARFYVKKFGIPFPYLCDPDFGVRRAWGLDVRSHSLGWYVKAFVKGATGPEPPNDFGSFAPAPREFPALLADEDTGFFILDRQGVIRYALAGAYRGPGGIWRLPGNDEILRELRACEKEKARS
jgi:peroxiredoxin